jgi:hypothetical protein
MLLRRHVWIRIIEIQPEVLSRPKGLEDLVRLQTDQADGTVKEEILNESAQHLQPVQADQDEGDGIKAKSVIARRSEGIRARKRTTSDPLS